MAKFLAAKLASLAAVISSAALLSGCETSSGKPEICPPGISDPRCPKVLKPKHKKVKAVEHNGGAKGKNY